MKHYTSSPKAERTGGRSFEAKNLRDWATHLDRFSPVPFSRYELISFPNVLSMMCDYATKLWSV